MVGVRVPLVVLIQFGMIHQRLESTMDKNKKDSDELGMAWGTANNRLRKLVIFSLIQKCGEDNCVRCGQRIVSVDDMSIEHIKPWRGNDVDLFWSVDNIAFSHVQCNTTHRPGGAKFKMAPEGTAWCGRCQDYKSVEMFHKDRARRSGYRGFCKDCT